MLPVKETRSGASAAAAHPRRKAAVLQAAGQLLWQARSCPALCCTQLWAAGPAARAAWRSRWRRTTSRLLSCRCCPGRSPRRCWRAGRPAKATRTRSCSCFCRIAAHRRHGLRRPPQARAATPFKWAQQAASSLRTRCCSKRSTRRCHRQRQRLGRGRCRSFSLRWGPRCWKKVRRQLRWCHRRRTSWEEVRACRRDRRKLGSRIEPQYA